MGTETCRCAKTEGIVPTNTHVYVQSIETHAKADIYIYTKASDEEEGSNPQRDREIDSLLLPV